MNDLILKFKDELNNHGLYPEEVIIPNDGLKRCKVESDKGSERSGWHVLFDNGNFLGGCFGNWKTGLQKNWCSRDLCSLSQTERNVLDKNLLEAKAQYKTELQEKQSQAAEEASTIWGMALPAQIDHPYLLKKQALSSNLRLGDWERTWQTDSSNRAESKIKSCLLIPLYNDQNQLCSLQAIAPNGEKYFLPGGRKRGCFYWLGDDSETIFIAEGFATASSIHQANNCKVYIAFDASNLKHVAPIIKRLHPDKKIILAADNDQWKPEVGNIGVNKAIEAAKLIDAEVCTPCFDAFPDALASKPTDFNDLHVLAGLDKVKQQLLEQRVGFQKIESFYKRVDGLAYCKLSDVVAEPISWLWKNRIALGKLTLITGDPGSGKSQLTQGMFAAHVTKGKPFPDGMPCPQGSIIIINVEDGLSDTIKPRLIANGADSDKVVAIGMVNVDGKDRAFNLKDDISRLEKLILEAGDVRALVIDPITAVLGNGIDSNSNSDVRAVLAPIADLAAKHNFALIGVTHRPKSTNSAMNAFIGSIGFVAAPRSAFIVLKDPEVKNRRFFAPVKNNIGDDKTGFAFIIDSVTTEGIETSCVTWEQNPIEVDVTALLSQECAGGVNRREDKSVLEQAKSFLLELLSEQDVHSIDIYKETKLAGISKASITRAKTELGVTAYKENQTGKWKWKLPKKPSEQVDHLEL